MKSENSIANVSSGTANEGCSTGTHQSKNKQPKPAALKPFNRLIPPDELLAMPKPWPAEVDCDEFAMLIASMLLNQGYPVQFVTIADDVMDPTKFTHVFVQAISKDGSKYSLDPYCDGPGQEVPLQFRRKEWGVIYPTKRAAESGGK